MTVNVFAIERLPAETEYSQDHRDDTAPNEGGLHDDVHEERDAVGEVEAVDRQAQERRDSSRPDGATILKCQFLKLHLEGTNIVISLQYKNFFVLDSGNPVGFSCVAKLLRVNSG